MRPEPRRTSRPLVATIRRAVDSGSSRWYGIAGLLCLIVGIGLAVVTAFAQDDILDRRQRACEGTILLPAWWLVIAWASVVIGFIALALSTIALAKRRSSRPAIWSAGCEVFVGALCALSILGLLFDLLLLHDTYHFTVPFDHPVCSG